MAEKKKFKFEMWMLGLVILPIGIGIAIWDASRSESVELGGACTHREHCAPPADACMDLGDDSVCTVMCGASCPQGFKCVTLDVTMKNQAGFRDIKGMRYCFLPELAARLGADPGKQTTR